MSKQLADIVARWEVQHGRACGQVLLSKPQPWAQEYFEAFLAYRRALEVLDLYVPPSKRALGWGRQLMDRAVAWSDRTGTPLLLRACPWGDDAIALTKLVQFYASYGFRVPPQILKPKATQFQVPWRTVMWRIPDRNGGL